MVDTIGSSAPALGPVQRTLTINLISLEEKLDTSSAAGELVFHVFGAIAHFERRLISERTKDGIAAARKRGKKPGRPSLDKETVSALQKLIGAGLTAGQAAKQVSVRCAPPNGADFDGLVTTIDRGHLGALYGCEAEEAALAG